MNPTHELPDVDPTPADILRGAAHYLRSHGWVQGVLYANTTALTPPACALGALGMAAFGEPILVPPPTDRPGWHEHRQAANALHDYLDLPGDGDAVDFTIGTWNDTPGRTVDQVIAALLATADEWEAQHTPPGSDRR